MDDETMLILAVVAAGAIVLYKPVQNIGEDIHSVTGDAAGLFHLVTHPFDIFGDDSLPTNQISPSPLIIPPIVHPWWDIDNIFEDPFITGLFK